MRGLRQRDNIQVVSVSHSAYNTELHSTAHHITSHHIISTCTAHTGNPSPAQQSNIAQHSNALHAPAQHSMAQQDSTAQQGTLAAKAWVRRWRRQQMCATCCRGTRTCSQLSTVMRAWSEGCCTQASPSSSYLTCPDSANTTPSNSSWEKAQHM